MSLSSQSKRYVLILINLLIPLPCFKRYFKFEALDRNQKGIRDFIKNLRPILHELSPSGSAEEIDRITNLALTESMRSLIFSNTTLASGKSSNSSHGSGGGINVTEEEFGRKVTDFITPILETKDKALEESNDKIGQLEGLLYDVRRDLGPVTITLTIVFRLNF